ncbi:MAG: uracil-xanthine permease [Clostridiales bacterium]|nr:MAG: uracil-xanthine permease [Clostridiales bacterium]
MKMIYGVNDKPPFAQLIVFAIQQLLAIMAATLVVPVIVGNEMSPAAALFGAGIGTLVYLAFTKGRSPVFLGSSFAFIGSMCTAFAGAVSMSVGYVGLIIGAFFAGLVYVVIAIVVKISGVGWVNKLMPAVVIGPTVAIIGLSLAGNAVGDLLSGDICTADGVMATSPYVALICGLVTLAVTMLSSTYGKKALKLIPFIMGILAGYAVAAIFTVIGNSTGMESLCVIDFSIFANMGGFFELPPFTFVTAKEGLSQIDAAYIGTVAVAYVPVAFVVFAEHIADHKNLSSIIEKDLLEDPGLHRTLLGDGVGSMVGAFFGGCPNTTYGESVGCVAITRNASVVTIMTAGILAMIISFITPFVAFVDSIPPCVMGGVCMALYGFIAVSGLKMIQKIDLDEDRNLFVVSVILISGIGGLTLSFGKVTLTSVACALILGILTNVILSKKVEHHDK